MKYRNISPSQQLLPALHLLVQPGEVFESDVEINNVNFARVTEQPVELRQMKSEVA